MLILALYPNLLNVFFIEKGVPEQNIHIDYISSVIAVHTGLGCIAIQYIREEN